MGAGVAKSKSGGSVDGQLYSKQDYEVLRAERRALNDWLTIADKAEACGVECQFLRSQRDSMDSQLAAIEQHFMTPPPR